MKRLLILSLALVLMLVGFTSCSKTCEDYEAILDEADYDVDSLKKSSVKNFFEALDLDEDDYPFENAIEATKKTKLVTIIEFESSSVAEDFAEEAEDLEDYFEEVEVSGNCVIMASSKAALKDALGE